MLSLKLENLITDNTNVFRKELKKVIKPSFDGIENPTKYENILGNIIAKSKRSSLLRQSQLVAAATEYLESKKNKSLLISAEMGTGKTDMAIKISMSDKLIPVYMIVCPSHLVQTWKEELKENYRDPNAYKVIRVKRWEDIAPYAKRNLWNDGIKYYFIITKENLKLSYAKKVAVEIKKKRVILEQVIDGETHLIENFKEIACCPDCGHEVLEADGNILDLDKTPRLCDGEVRTYHLNEDGTDGYKTCGSILRTPNKGGTRMSRTRESVSDFIFKNFTKGSYNVILDEVHEYKGANTGQGNAMGRLVANSRKTMGLTGTLMNGYASSLFHLLYRLNPRLMKDLGFEHDQVSNFVKTYGSFENTYEARTIDKEGVVTRMGRKIGIPKERAKISPHLLSVLLGMTIFLKLDEIKMPNNLKLPAYEEVVDLVEMDEDLKKPVLSYIQKLSGMIRKNKSLLGSFATAAIALPDMPFTYRDEQGLISYNPEFTREEYGLTNKEKRLIENVRVELDQGRDCLVYLTFSRQQIATDLKNILTDAFPDKKVLFLPPTVPAAKRKEWIKNNPSDVLICNPELVKTGLTLLNFVTIIFYETTYNVFTLKQASRRSWRIGQTEDIKVIFMAYANTPQHKALELIGAKIMAANSLEGKFSGEEDLSSLGEDDTNLQLALAKSIMNGDTGSKKIEMTSIKNFGDGRDYNSFELYYQSLLDEDEKIRLLEVEQEAMQTEVFEYATENEMKEISLFDSSIEDLESDVVELNVTAPVVEEIEPIIEDEHISFVSIVGKGKKAKSVKANNLFDLVAQNESQNTIQLAFDF